MDEASRSPQLDKKHAIILLRSVVVVCTSYLILFGQAPQAGISIAYILALLLTNAALALTPGHWFRQPRFSAVLLLGDTALVLMGLYLTVGCFSQDFLIIYFFTIFLTTATSSLAEIALGAAMVSGLYGYWLWLTSTHTLGAGEWLRLPFFFIVAVFYAFVTEETKRERYFRHRAERENERLRFLLQLSNALPQWKVAEELIGQIGNLVEAAFPRLNCRSGGDVTTDRQQRALFPLCSNGRGFGTLRVGTKDGSPLWPNEATFCKVAAAIAANVLYTGEQVMAAQDGTRIKEEFLSTLSHELRSPLHVILGNAEILSDMVGPAADPVARETLDRLGAGACRLLDLIEEMLCFVELRSGRSTVPREPVDLRVLFEECAAAMFGRLASQPVRFEWHVADDVPTLLTDARMLRLIVNALLSNAAKFTAEGAVQLSAERRGRDVEIAVRDSGIGIEPKDLADIFQPFRQLDGSLTRRFQGLGLGLTLARELTAALGGALEVESQPKQGSTFRVRLPLVAPSASPEPATGRAAAPLRWSLSS
ncbi:MAG: sensor histidine kinase [Candidatus Binatia bacterium]